VSTVSQHSTTTTAAAPTTHLSTELRRSALRVWPGVLFAQHLELLGDERGTSSALQHHRYATSEFDVYATRFGASSTASDAVTAT
jgi:hypothetical protein